ncbi:MAG: MobA/MobL family protein, partial [Rubrivivax sp.]
AYRSGECLRDERTGQVHDYTRKGGIEGNSVVLPGGASASREQVWNAVEKACKRADSIIAREIEVSIPEELTPAQAWELVQEYGTGLADRYGVAVDMAMHAPRLITDADLARDPDRHVSIDAATGDRTNGNRHAHVLMSSVHVDGAGNAGKKAIALDPIACARAKLPNTMDVERSIWADLCNAALARAHVDARVDHRSYAARGIDRMPQVHLGPQAAAIERRTGQPSEVRRMAAAQVEQVAALADVAVAEAAPEAAVAQLRAELAAAEVEAARLAAAAIEQAQRTAAEAAPPPNPEPDVRTRLEKVADAYNASQRRLSPLQQRALELRRARTGSYDPEERVRHARDTLEVRRKIRSETPFWNLRAWLSTGAELRSAQAELAEIERLSAIPPTADEQALQAQIKREKAAQDRLWAEGRALQKTLQTLAAAAQPTSAPQPMRRPEAPQNPGGRDDDPDSDRDRDRRPRQRG